MAEILDLMKEKEKRKQKKRINKLTKNLTIIAVVVFLLFLFRLFADVPIQDIILTQFRLSQVDGSFPIANMDTKKYDIFDIDGKIGVMTDSRVYLYTKSGKEVLNLSHGLEFPQWQVQGRDLLYYSVGSKVVYIQNIYGSQEKVACPGRVLFAKLSENGVLAIGWSNQRGRTRLDVYEKDKTGMWKWNDGSSDSILMSMAFSQNNQQVLLNMVDAESGVLKNIFQFYSLSQEEPLGGFQIPGVLTVAVELDSQMNAIVLTDNGLFKYSVNGDLLAHYDFPEQKLLSYEFDNTFGYTLVFEDAGDFNKNHMMILDQQFTPLFTIDLTSKLSDYYFSRNTLYLLKGDTIEWYNHRGELVGERPAPAQSLRFIVLSNVAYVLTMRDVQRVQMQSKVAVVPAESLGEPPKEPVSDIEEPEDDASLEEINEGEPNLSISSDEESSGNASVENESSEEEGGVEQ